MYLLINILIFVHIHVRVDCTDCSDLKDPKLIIGKKTNKGLMVVQIYKQYSDNTNFWAIFIVDNSLKFLLLEAHVYGIYLTDPCSTFLFQVLTCHLRGT